MKNYYYLLFFLIFFSNQATSQIRRPSNVNPNEPTQQVPVERGPIDQGPVDQGPVGGDPIGGGPVGGGPVGEGSNSNNSTQLSNLLYNEIFTAKISTPNTASFAPVTFSNVSEFTGSANINIPIYQIQVGNINIPIELNYSCSGIKVDETASNVGQNWSLNAGGIVTKVIKGMEDFKVGIEGNLPYDVNNHKLRFFKLGTSAAYGMQLKEVGWLMQNENISLNKYYDLPSSSMDKIFTIKEMEFITTKKDLSPDLFYANAPGLNTSFTHRRDGSVMEIAFQGNKIATTIGQTSVIPFFNEFRDDTKFQGDLKFFDGGPPRKIQAISKIEITNINGTQYLFDQLDVNQYVNRGISDEYIISPSSKDITSQEVMAYKVSKVKDFYGNEVSFEYEKYSINYPEYQKTSSFYVNSSSGNQLIQDLTSTEIRYPSLNRISKIIYAEGTVTFKYEESRKDIPGDFALSKIIINDINNNVIKTIVLEYDYMISNNNCNAPTCKRLRLLSVQEKGKNTAVKPPHRFYYNDEVQLPERGSNITDYLGYANGPVSSQYNNVSSVSCGMCLMPPPTLYYTPNNKELSISPFPIFTQSFITQGRSMKPDFNYTKAGVINKIKYPTGGTEEFEYDLNDFYSSPSGTNVKSGGLRVFLHKLIDTKGAIQVTKYNYVDARNNSSGILNNLPTLGIAHVYSETLAKNFLGLSSYALNEGLILHTFTNSRSDFDVVEGSNVGYARVLLKENADNGYLEKIFSTREDFPIENPLFTYPPYDKSKIEFGFNNGWRLPTSNNTQLLIGKLKYIRKYDKTNNLIEETKISHQYDIFNQITDKIGISRKEVFPSEVGSPEPIEPDFAFYPSVYSSRNLVNETKTTTKYEQNKIVNITSTNFDTNYSVPLSVESITNESGTVTSLIKKTSYSFNSSNPLMTNLVDSNRITEPVTVKSIKKTGELSDQLSSQEVLYTNFTIANKNLVLPRAVQALKGTQTTSNPFEERIQFHNYDKFGHPTETSKNDDMHTVSLWGYNYTKPIAKIENATYAQVMSALGKNNSETLEYLQNYSEESLKIEIQKIRTNLNNAMVTSYLYKPLVGLASIVDPKGTSISYEYDDLNRLKKIKDEEQNIIEEYCYGYSGLINDCQDNKLSPSYPTDPEENYISDLDLQIKIGNFKSYRIPVACGRGVNWEDKLPDGAPYKGRGILSLHDKLYFPNPSQIGVDYSPGYFPLPTEYLTLNLQYPREEYTCNYFAERSGNTFELLGLNNPKFSPHSGNAEIKWWMEIDGRKIEIPKIQEYTNVFFIPKCLEGTYARIICSIKTTSRSNGEDSTLRTINYIAKSDLIKLKSGLDEYDDVPALYKLAASELYSGEVCGNLVNSGIGNSSENTTVDPGYWADLPWTIDNGVVPDIDFKISIEKFKMYDIPVPAFLNETFSWQTNMRPSLHPLFYFPRPTSGYHGEQPYSEIHAFETFIVFPYVKSYYSNFYVKRGGYRFDINEIKRKIGNSSDYQYQWSLKLADTGQELPLIRTLESKELFFIPPALNGKKGKLICRGTIFFGLAGPPIYFESENITFQEGLSNEDNLGYQVEFLDDRGL